MEDIMDFDRGLYIRAATPDERRSRERISWEDRGDHQDMHPYDDGMLGWLLICSAAAGLWFVIGFVVGLAF